MKISDEPITLTMEHSRNIRALAHACGIKDLNVLLEAVFFSISPDSHLECHAHEFEYGSPESERIWEAHELAKSTECWSEFSKAVESMPPFEGKSNQTPYLRLLRYVA